MEQPPAGPLPPVRGPLARYARAPRIATTVSWQTSLATALGVLQGRQVLSVGAPGLFRMISSNLPGATQAVLDVYWRAWGEHLQVAALGNNPPAGQRIGFQGPYAWFPAPGLYEIVGASLTSAGAALLIRGELAYDVSEADWLGIAQGEGSRSIQSGATLVAPAGSVALPFASSFFLYRHLIIQNSGANPGSIQFGISGVNAIYTIAAGATMTFDTRSLGRHTLFLGSALGTTFQLTLSFW